MGLDLKAAVGFEWLILVCIPGQDTDTMLALDKHPDSNVTGFFGLVQHFLLPRCYAFGLISDSAISICKQEIQHEG